MNFGRSGKVCANISLFAVEAARPTELQNIDLFHFTKRRRARILYNHLRELHYID